MRYFLTHLMLWVISKLNPYKDNILSQYMFDLAEQYNTRPGTYNYPGFRQNIGI